MRQRVFTGVVTQLQDRHGTVDRDVRFAMSVVVGRAPLVGEKVLVKAVQDHAQSMKWTAQRVQVLNGQPFKSPPPLLHSATPNLMPSILGNKRQPLLKSPKIPPLIPGMQPNSGGMLQLPHHQNLPWSAPWGGGSRKRHNEIVPGRRGRHWEEAGGSWGGDNAHQKRRRWKAPFEEETSKKSSSQTSTGSPLFSFFPRDSQACENLELQRRYPHLHAPPSLFHVQLCWPESFPSSNPFPLAGPCHFHIGSGQPRAEVTPTPDSTENPVFSVKVLLLSLPAITDFYTQCCNYADDEKPPADAVHPTSLFKFLLLDKAGELQLPGGSWCKEDGANPAKDSSTIVHTAIRCVMEQTDLDLSACSQWHKMAELRLLSGDEVETVFVLMPDVWNLMPTADEWSKLREEREDGESPLPDVPSLVVQPSAGFALSTLSLASLLEPRTSQSRDAFEVGLVSELLSEMLQRDFGLQLYHSLCSLPQTPTATLPDFEMQAEDSSGALVEEAKKTSKDVPNKEAGDAKTTTNEEEEMEIKMDEEPEENEPHIQEEAESYTEVEEAISDDIELPRRVLLSWVFFDRQFSGFLREEDVQSILLSLGLYLTTAQAQDLTRKMSVDGKCMYRKLCSRWTDSDDVACDLSAQGNKLLLPGLPRKEKGPTRRSSSNQNPDVVNYKGSVLNIPNLLQHLENSKAVQQQMEKRLADLQAMLEAAKARPDSDEQERLKSRLEKVEALNKTYEKTLKENAGHMLTVIEKMQKMVDQAMIGFESNMPAVAFQDLVLNIYIVIFGTGIFVFVLSLIFCCCFISKLRHQAQPEKLAYKLVVLKDETKHLNIYGQTCAVCLEDFRIKDELATLPCQHGFHKRCLLKWLEVRCVCPMCNKPIGAPIKHISTILDELV
ncbi:Cell cycle and apoptosis regulator protein 2 [Bagarius yarrelli]|uniref:Cell cycle and apoptosis regulator protein 2 n=1 Tax=Bagarius yarrelli TaxID=175774 RepID=A0A556U3B0_BAGYA|nr:Cell cycle and apoptosis regulator protein 2 [Bagarius yarrelli]